MSSLRLTKSDLDPFADLGTSVIQESTKFVIVRNGQSITVEYGNDGYFVSRSGEDNFYSNAGALLSAEAFGDLPRIARNQTLLLSPSKIGSNSVRVTTELKTLVGDVPLFSKEEEPWIALDRWLCEKHRSQQKEGTDLLLIDGPAGVGKTTVVRETALLRARGYDGSDPLLLQIASRGRVLQNISDLIAFSLQDVRSNITIGQLKSLMRHGLVILAIDGFDELSDPNGFETAWSGLNSLIREVRGLATFLLAGRETFVSTEIIRRQVKSFDEKKDRLASLSIGDPTPEDARAWLLRSEGWTPKLLQMDFVEPIFVTGSYALRPFFLDVIAREPAALTSDAPPASDLLSYLVEVMIEREGHKFVDALDPPNGGDAAFSYGTYVRRFLEEIARDLAENQADSISEDALDLLALVAAEGLLPTDQIAAVVKRAKTVVFLAKDLRGGHVRFAHEQLMQHFLACEALRSVGEGETPRYIRRNLFGRESLEVFAHVARGREDEANEFLTAVRNRLAMPSRDRTNTNLAVLGIAAACAIVPENLKLSIQGIGINEMHFPFAAPKGINIRDTTISILHAASSDIRKLEFGDGVHIATLEIDKQTLWPNNIPIPQTLVHPEGIITVAKEIENYIRPRKEEKASGKLEWTEGILEIFGRIERYRAFWLKTSIEDADKQGKRIILHPDWGIVYPALRDLNLITVKSRQASGRWAEFVHFRQDVQLREDEDLHRLLME